MLIKRIKLGFSIYFYRLLSKKFKSFGENVKIIFPLGIDGFSNISVGNNVVVNYKTWLAAVPLTSDSVSLQIGEGTIIGNFNHIYATKSINIGKKVLTADKVYISDNLHGYENINIPIMDQPIVQNGSVEIGDGTWIGENACILGVNIGKNCVIGSNSVVTHDIPDYCVAVGSPAKIIKRYCVESMKWIIVKD